MLSPRGMSAFTNDTSNNDLNSKILELEEELVELYENLDEKEKIIEGLENERKTYISNNSEEAFREERTEILQDLTRYRKDSSTIQEKNITLQFDLNQSKEELRLLKHDKEQIQEQLSSQNIIIKKQKERICSMDELSQDVKKKTVQ
mmetsp:Transcript_36186/g.84608  ORF Transcript_36186/g.84608 Transcript_36186/m.84608 type:complete len:147 (+) Transcript_36186:795-1235(+)